MIALAIIGWFATLMFVGGCIGALAAKLGVIHCRAYDASGVGALLLLVVLWLVTFAIGVVGILRT